MESQTAVEKTEKLRGPGVRLRLAREASSMTQTTVSKELNLTSEIIAAIEADDYSRINNFTFVRGYLRSYSKLMKLPGDEIVEEFNRLGLLEERSARAVNIDMTKSGFRGKLDSRLITYAVTGIVAAVLLTWWISHRNANDSDSILTLSALSVSESLETSIDTDL